MCWLKSNVNEYWPICTLDIHLISNSPEKQIAKIVLSINFVVTNILFVIFVVAVVPSLNINVNVDVSPYKVGSYKGNLSLKCEVQGINELTSKWQWSVYYSFLCFY